MSDTITLTDHIKVGDIVTYTGKTNWEIIEVIEGGLFARVRSTVAGKVDHLLLRKMYWPLDGGGRGEPVFTAEAMRLLEEDWHRRHPGRRDDERRPAETKRDVRPTPLKPWTTAPIPEQFHVLLAFGWQVLPVVGLDDRARWIASDPPVAFVPADMDSVRTDRCADWLLDRALEWAVSR